MKSIDKLNKLAREFEDKLITYAQTAPQPVANQLDTETLFFGLGYDKNAFIDNVKKSGANGSIFSYLQSIWQKTQKTVSYNLQVNAIPGKGAAWILTTTPPTMKAGLSKLLNDEFSKVFQTTMEARAVEANAKAKAASPTLVEGWGTKEVATAEMG
jgi:hypothetical protein